MICDQLAGRRAEDGVAYHAVATTLD